MEELDAAMAARVWERVQQRPPQEMDASLYGSLQTLAAYYRALSAQFPQARALANDAASCALSVRGLQALKAPPPASRRPPVPRERAESTLKKCAHAEQSLIDQLARASADAPWRCVYSALSTRATTRLMTTLSILGTLR